MKPFRVTGQFKMGRTMTPFTLETVGADEKAATDRVLSTLGSRHRVDRHHIKITSIKPIKPEEIDDPAVEKLLTMGK